MRQLLFGCVFFAMFATGGVANAQFIRGDADGDGTLTIADVIFTLSWLSIAGGTPTPIDAADSNDNGVVSLADVSYTLAFLFGPGSPPPPPFPGAGFDPTPTVTFPTAPTGEVEYRLTTGVGCPGSSGLTTIFVSNTSDLEAFAMRLVFDPDLSFAGSSSAPIETLLGASPDFLNVETPTVGVLQIDVLISFLGGGVFPAGFDQAVFDIIVDVSTGAPTSTTLPIVFEDDPGSSPARYNMGVILGQPVLADFVDGGILTDCAPVDFRRGDTNEDSVVSVSDAVFAVEWLFLGGPAPSCAATGDVNDDGAVNVGDIVFLLDALILGSAPIPAPFPDCGAGGASFVGCASYGGTCP